MKREGESVEVWETLVFRALKWESEVVLVDIFNLGSDIKSSILRTGLFPLDLDQKYKRNFTRLIKQADNHSLSDWSALAVVVWQTENSKDINRRLNEVIES